MPFWLAVVRLEHAEWLAAEGSHSDASFLLSEATQVFERIGARPWVDRVNRSARAAVTAP
jgi:hypothetical protein